MHNSWKACDCCKVRIVHEAVAPTLTSYTEIYRAEPQRRRECLYYIALGHYKMGNVEEARKFNRAHKP